MPGCVIHPDQQHQVPVQLLQDRIQVMIQGHKFVESSLGVMAASHLDELLKNSTAWQLPSSICAAVLLQKHC